MSSNSQTQAHPTEAFFRNANGERLTLEERGSSSGNIINLALRSKKDLNASLYLALFCATFFTWILSDIFILFVVSVCILALQCKLFITSTKQDTLLVIESVGVHIENKRGFGIFTSTEFLPWDIVEDVFINEVIKGVTTGALLSYIYREGISWQAGFKEISSTVSRSITRKKMPGIHLQAFSQLDWLDQEKGSLLTVPGSYWLCHRKNIYKFIFRYHRTVKNTMQFSYSRQLLKIIRRIIKCHPTQGQQFSTQNLLVTYNCTSWTRQDKMFAIMKFKQRTNAATFSHAFVLTIRICPSSESLFDLKYPIVKEENIEEKVAKTVICSTDKVSLRKTAMCQSKKVDNISKLDAIEDTLNNVSNTIANSNLPDDNLENSASFHENLDARIESETITTGTINEHSAELHDSTEENKSTNCNIKNCFVEKNTEQHSAQEDSSGAAERTNKIEIKSTSNIHQESKSIAIQKEEQEIQNIQEDGMFSSSPVTGIIKNCVDELSNNFDLIESSVDEDSTCTANNKNSLNGNKGTACEADVDSNDIPYRYFKKEIENGERDTTSDTSTIDRHVKDMNKDAVAKVIRHDVRNEKRHFNETVAARSQENDKQHVQTLTNAHDDQTQNNAHHKSHKARKQKSRESERKTVPDDKVLRSSNITDLVMEGLMFTIRQGQDSVAVIEQKTKLEVDEVLENSEKFETKAGEKCLLNSSLLRLESLVTMIDSPRDKDKHRKTGRAIGAHSLPYNVLRNDAVYNLDVNYADRKLDKSNVPNYDIRHHALGYLTPYESRWQRFSSAIRSGDSHSASGNTMKKEERPTEWLDGDDTREKEKDIVAEVSLQSPTLSSFERPNAELQNGNLSTNDTDLEETGGCDVGGHYSSPLPRPSSSPSKMPATETSAVSKESGATGLSQQKASLPKIISDKAITVEQMPLALQNVLRQTCRKRRFPFLTSSRELPRECKTQRHDTAPTGDATSKTEDKRANPRVATNSFVESTVDPEETKDSKDESRLTIDKNTPVAAACARNARGRSNDAPRASRRSSSSKHSSPRKLQDITEEFYYDLLQAHDREDGTVQQRRLRQRRRSLNNPDDVKSSKVRIEMLKFIQDITEGARVVVRRLNVERKETINPIY